MRGDSYSGFRGVSRNTDTARLRSCVREAIRDAPEGEDLDRALVEEFEPFVSNVCFDIVRDAYAVPDENEEAVTA